MRMVGLALAAAIGGLGVQSSAPPVRLVVVIDGDAAAAEPQAAARLREALLSQIDPDVAAAYYELTRDGLRPVPAADAASFRRTVFTVTPPRYGGVAVTFTESVEVLRGNESMRDALIARGCGSGDCGGPVRAAVEAEVKRTEGASARKVRMLVTAASDWRGARVVVLTAGWPTRDDGRVRLDRALPVLREHGASLTVVHVPSPEPYRGLVRDASESLAAQLPARFAVLAGEADVTRAVALIGPGTPAMKTNAAPDPLLPETPTTGHPPSAPETGTAPEPAAAASAAEASAPASSEDATLRRAANYVARFERTFTEVIWHERYAQEVRVWRRFGSSGASTSLVAARRRFDSELFFAWLPQDATWISVRDVVSVDGVARPAGERRLAALAARGSVSLLELRELARENGRFNIGSIVRTFNEPTLPLLFLSERKRAKVAFTAKGSRRAGGRRVSTYAFVEEGRPTVIRNDQRDLPVRGTFDIDPATGEIVASTIEMAEPTGASGLPSGLTGRMAVDYRPHAAFDVLVPHEMQETYTLVGRQQVVATASYSDFRRFATSGRLILTK